MLGALAKKGSRFLRQHVLANLSTNLVAALLASGVYMIIHNMFESSIVGEPQLFTLFWWSAGLLLALTSRPLPDTP